MVDSVCACVWPCVSVCVFRALELKFKCLCWHISFITGWQKEEEVQAGSQTGRIKASPEVSSGCRCQTQGGTVLTQPAFPRACHTVVE